MCLHPFCCNELVPERRGCLQNLLRTCLRSGRNANSLSVLLGAWKPRLCTVQASTSSLLRPLHPSRCSKSDSRGDAEPSRGTSPLDGKITRFVHRQGRRWDCGRLPVSPKCQRRSRALTVGRARLSMDSPGIYCSFTNARALPFLKIK